MSALLVKLARSLYEHNNSFGSAAFIETGALPLVLLNSPLFHRGPKLRAAEKKRVYTVLGESSGLSERHFDDFLRNARISFFALLSRSLPNDIRSVGRVSAQDHSLHWVIRCLSWKTDTLVLSHHDQPSDSALHVIVPTLVPLFSFAGLLSHQRDISIEFRPLRLRYSVSTWSSLVARNSIPKTTHRFP